MALKTKNDEIFREILSDPAGRIDPGRMFR